VEISILNLTQGAFYLDFFDQLLGHLHPQPCDNCLDLSTISTPVPATYHQVGSGNFSFIDHFCVSSSLANSVARSLVWDSGENLSDHIPLCLVLSVIIADHLADRSVVRPVAPPSKRLR